MPKVEMNPLRSAIIVKRANGPHYDNNGWPTNPSHWEKCEVWPMTNQEVRGCDLYVSKTKLGHPCYIIETVQRYTRLSWPGVVVNRTSLRGLIGNTNRIKYRAILRDGGIRWWTLTGFPPSDRCGTLYPGKPGLPDYYMLSIHGVPT